MIVETLVLNRPIRVEHRIGAQVDRRVEELDDERTEGVGSREAWDLISEFKIIENFLDIRREAIEIGLEISFQLLLAPRGSAQPKKDQKPSAKQTEIPAQEALVTAVDRGAIEISTLYARGTCSHDIVEAVVPVLLQPTCAAKRERLT
jgi:predicted RNase H-like nuclease